MKLHFSSMRGETMSHFFSRISWYRDSCQGLPPPRIQANNTLQLIFNWKVGPFFLLSISCNCTNSCVQEKISDCPKSLSCPLYPPGLHNGIHVMCLPHTLAIWLMLLFFHFWPLTFFLDSFLMLEHLNIFFSFKICHKVRRRACIGNGDGDAR